MRSTTLWARLLGLVKAVVEDVAFDEDDECVVVSVRPRKAAKRRCGRCGKRCPGYDRGEGRRRWRALDLGTVRAFLEADSPRVRCVEHGVVAAQVPWARHGAGHTYAFDDSAAWLVTHCSKSAVRELLRVAWRTVGSIVTRVVTDAEMATDRFANLRRIGIDEISYKRGHKYLTVVVDHDTGVLLWAHPGRDHKTLEKFFDRLGEDRCAEIRLVSADAAEWISNVVADRCKNAELCLDPFHIVAWATKAARRGPPGGVERSAARRPERSREGLEERPLRAVEEPRGSHRPPRGQARLDRPDQQAPLPRLPAERTAPAGVRAQGRRRHRPARRVVEVGAALPHPVIREARQGDHRTPCVGIEAALTHGLSNARVESVNTKLRLLTRIAFGFRSPDALIALAMLDLGGLCPPLPGRRPT